MKHAQQLQRVLIEPSRTGKGSTFEFGDGLHGHWYESSHARATQTSAVVLCHGVHQHALMYDDFAARLASEGFAVLSYDLRGFGQSAGERGMVAPAAFEQALVDLRAAIALAESRAARVFVFGHSLGGLLACMLASAADAPRVQGYVLSSPSVAVAPPLRLIGPMLRCAPGSAVLSTYELDGGSGNAAFKQSWRDQPASLCDPARPFRAAYVRQAYLAQLSARARLARLAADALILGGDLDRHEHDHGACTDLHAALSARASAGDSAQHPPKTAPLPTSTLKQYSGRRHELIFEAGSFAPGENEVVDDLVAWLQARARPS